MEEDQVLVRQQFSYPEAFKVEAVGDMQVEGTPKEMFPLTPLDKYTIFVKGPYLRVPYGLPIEVLEEVLTPKVPDDDEAPRPPGAVAEVDINGMSYLRMPCYQLPSNHSLASAMVEGVAKAYELKASPVFDTVLQPTTRVRLKINSPRPVEGLFLILSVLLVEKEGKPMANLLCGACTKALPHKNEDYPDYEIEEGKKVKLCPACASSHFEEHQSLNCDVGEAIVELLENASIEPTGDLLEDVKAAAAAGTHAQKQLMSVYEYGDDLFKSAEQGGDLPDAEDILHAVMAISTVTVNEEQEPEVEEEEEEETEE